jgi:hypothetical protein
MYPTERRRLPISTRHAFALAFDLAFRRDPIHSLLVPVLLRAPWGVALAVMPDVDTEHVSAKVVLLATIALFGDFLTSLVIGAMLRLRARSVFNTNPAVRPAPVGECYAQGMRRVPWVVVTEVARYTLLAGTASLIVLPPAFIRFSTDHALFDLGRNLLLLAVAFLMALPFFSLAHRLGVATEAVVLQEKDTGGAFQSSFRMMKGHFERWFELVLVGGILLLAPVLLLAALSLPIPALLGVPGKVILLAFELAMWSVIQYAWTFFYLRLVEIEQPPLVEPMPMFAAEAAAVDAMRLSSSAGHEGTFASPVAAITFPETTATPTPPPESPPPPSLAAEPIASQAASGVSETNGHA